MESKPSNPQSEAESLSQWPYPEQSTGDYLQDLPHCQHCWDAVGPAREAYSPLAEDIGVYLAKHCHAVPTVTYSLIMVGESRETSSPTIVFWSSNRNARETVRNRVNQSGILEEYPGFLTMDRDRPPDSGL